MTGYLRQFVQGYSMVAAPLTNILRDKRFASKRARALRIPWDADTQRAFDLLKDALFKPPVLAFPAWHRPFTLHTDASVVGAGAVLMQDSGGVDRVIAYGSHRFSRTDSRRGATERECMAVLWALLTSSHIWLGDGSRLSPIVRR